MVVCMQYQSVYDLIQWAFIREYQPTPEQAGETVTVVRALLQKYAAAIPNDPTLPYMKVKGSGKPRCFALQK